MRSHRGSLEVPVLHSLLTGAMLLGVWCAVTPSRVAHGANPPDGSNCATENLLAGSAPSHQQAVQGSAALVTDGAAVPDGALWDGPSGVKLDSAAGSLTYDLGLSRSVGAVYLQADANDTYKVSGSLDGKPGTFKVLAEIPNVVDRGPGMRSRAIQFPPVTVRYLRVGEAEGDNAYSITEFAAFCRAPTPFPPTMRTVEAPMAAVAIPPNERYIETIDGDDRKTSKAFEAMLALFSIALVGGLLVLNRRPRTVSNASAASTSERFLPALLLLFVGSGCAALIYEVIWLQLLQLVIGSSAVSIGVLLGTFMGGMCIGSLGLARYVSSRQHPLRVYAYMELAIAGCGLLVLLAMPLVQGIYTAVVGHGIPGLLLRGIFAAVCLLPPTILMGATLPAVGRWVQTTPRGVSWLGYFYGGNTVGAVFGCLLAGFYLLRVHDMPTATFVAVALNLVVAGAALMLARVVPHQATEGGNEGGREGGRNDDARNDDARNDEVVPANQISLPGGAAEMDSGVEGDVGDRLIDADALPNSVAAAARSPEPPGAWAVYLVIGLSGMTALGAEIVWTRLFTLLLGGTTYTFSIILAVFLMGIALGSGAGSFIGRRSPDPRRALGFAQLLLIAAIGWTAWNLTSSLPYWPIDPGIASGPWYLFQTDLVRCLWAIFPPACLWGASFPLALAAVASKGQDGGRVVGRVYAANTIGAIVGAMSFSLFIIGWVGTRKAERILIGLAALAAITALAPLFAGRSQRPKFTVRSAAWVLIIAQFALVVGRFVGPVPALLVGHGRRTASSVRDHENFIFVGEGMNSSMAVSRDRHGILSYHNAGKTQASSQPQDMRLQRMLGHLTTLLPENPRNVLVIACGAGVTAGAASIDPRVERLTIAEIEPLVPRVVAEYFGDYNFNVVRNPKVRVEVDDARHFLTTTKEKFDAITSDPFDPWVKGAASLYTREFWELAKSHLNPGGVVTVFVQLYESGTAAVKSEIATFAESFPDAVVWGNTVRGEGYDIVLMGQKEPGRIDVDKMQRLLERPDFAPVARSLREIGFNSATALLSTFGGRAPDLRPWLSDAQVNRDRNLRLQFLAGFDFNFNEAADIYRGILRHRKYPDDLFSGSPETLSALRAMTLKKD